MHPHRHDADRSGRWVLALVALPAVWLAAVIIAPIDATFGAPGRFVLTALTFIILLAGLVGTVLNLRRYRAHLLVSRYSGATGAMKDTIQFALHERRLSTRGRLPLMVGAWSGLALTVLSRWPQCASIDDLRPAFAIFAGLCAVLLFLQPFHVRSHIVNAIYLRRYLRQQADHIGLRPRRWFNAGSKSQRRIAEEEGKFYAGGFDWNDDDLHKNAIILGAPGSGKTACVITVLLGSLIASRRDELSSSGILFDPKGAFHDKIGALCARLGRTGDLYILSAESWAEQGGTAASITWNPLDTPDSAIDVTSRIIVSMKLAGGVESRDSFFLDAARHFIRHSLTLLRAAMAPEPPSLLDIHGLCAEPADDPAEYRRLVGSLHRRYPDEVPAEIEAAVRYMETDWFPLPEKQRAGVRSTVNQLVDDFTAQPFSEMISGRSTIRIADLIDQGRILYVHLPLKKHERLSKILTNLIKLEFQREILRRVRKDRPSWLLADEYQTIFSSGEEQADSGFFEASRESRHANVVAAQNLSSFFKKSPNRSDVTNFFGLFAVKVFLRNTERETNEWASNLFGERSEIVVTMSEAARFDGWFKRNQTNYSRSTKALRIVPPEAFVELPIPMADDPSRQFAGSIVHLASRGTVAKLDLDWPIHRLLP